MFTKGLRLKNVTLLRMFTEPENARGAVIMPIVYVDIVTRNVITEHYGLT
jgi:hypothetical protein